MPVTKTLWIALIGEEPLTGEMIHQEFLKTGTEEQWLQSDLLIYAEAVDRVLNQEASFKLAEETFQQVKEKYEAFETAEIRAQYEEILQKYIVARIIWWMLRIISMSCMPIVKNYTILSMN